MMKIRAVFIVLIVILLSCQGNGHKISGQIREPAVAGQFYPDSKKILESQVLEYLDAAENLGISGTLYGLICPHAGYVYSGGIAAWSYKQLENHNYEVVAIIAPCHVEAFPFASVYSGDAYLTPLGEVRVDKKAARQLTSYSRDVRLSERGHSFNPGMRGEHSLEVQLPFIQEMLPGIPIIPVVIGTQSWHVIQSLGTALGDALKNRRALIIASSDLSHYHNYEECNRIDEKLIKSLRLYKPESFLEGIANGRFEACGAAPIAAMLIATQIMGAEKVEILKHANSGDIPGGFKDRVVGYLAAAVIGGKRMEDKSEELTLQEKKFLMNIARESVYNSVNKKRMPEPENIPSALRENRGAFVTLKKQGMLRGCIGYVLPIKPLYQTVIDVARSAALQDPRFPKVTPDELDDLEFEISVLTVPKTISDVNEIIVGKHGIIVKKGYYQGLLLPQVATEYNWDREEFLENTCRKAGLPTDAYKDKDTEIQIFSAQVFGEKDVAEK